MEIVTECLAIGNAIIIQTQWRIQEGGAKYTRLSFRYNLQARSHKTYLTMLTDGNCDYLRQCNYNLDTVADSGGGGDAKTNYMSK